MFLKIWNILKPSHVNEHFTYSKMHPTPNWIIMDENQSVDNIARHPVDTLTIKNTAAKKQTCH